MMVEPVDEDPGYIRMVAHEFVQRFYYDLFCSPGEVHKYYKDGSVMLHPEDGSIRSIRRSYTIEEIKKKISPLGYDKYSKVILENLDAYSYDSGIKVYVSGSLIGKDEITQSFSQCFLLEQHNGKRGWYIVVRDEFQYTKDEDPGYIRMVGHEFVQRFYYDSFCSPGVVHKYYKDGSVMLHPEDGSIRRSYTIEEIKKKISPLGYDKYSKVILENLDAYSYDSGIEVYVSGSLIGKDEITHSFSQRFLLEQQNGKRGWYIVVHDEFQYTKDFNNPHGKNKGLVNDDEDVDVDGYMGSVDNSVIDTDEEQNFTMTIQPDLGDPQDGSVIDAEPKLPKSPYTVLPRGGEAPSSSLIPSGSGSKEVKWTLVSSRAHKVKKEELPGSQKRARDEGERRNQSQNMPRKENKTDHHGKTVKEARLDSKEVLRALSNSPSEKTLKLITGHCRRRNVGNRAPIRDDTEKLLSTLPVKVERVNKGGAFIVTVPARTELILSDDERRNKELHLSDFLTPVLKKDSRGKK